MATRVLCMKMIFQFPACFLQEGRFQPLLVRCAGGIGDAAFIDVGNPSGVAADVDVRFRHVPFIMLARGMLGFDEGHDRVHVESRPSIEYVKLCRNDRLELCNVVCTGCIEDRANCVNDLTLIGVSRFCWAAAAEMCAEKIDAKATVSK